jgi:hypothetical protein
MSHKKILLISVPEPPPKDEGILVTECLLDWINGRNDINPEIKEKAIRLIQARDNYGFQKYGQHLRTGDGRDDIEDAAQEIGDAMQYVMKAILNNRNTKPIADMVNVLVLLLSR